MYLDALIVAGGSGKRFGRKKQFLGLLGVPVLKRAVSCFETHAKIFRIIVVVPKEDIPETKAMLAGSLKDLLVTSGGETRQESVRNGLSLAGEGRAVLIHDGVRPFVRPELIDRVIDGLQGVDGCIPGLALTDTVKETSDGLVVKTLVRDRLFQVQTPQAFVTRTIREEHINAARNGSGLFTDDSALLEAAGLAVKIVEGDPYNIKITFPEDLPMAEAILRCLSGSA